VLPFATEEVWSWWREGSVHRAPWPTAESLRTSADPGVVTAAGSALAALRKVKSEAKLPLRTEITAVELVVPAAMRPGVESALGDIRSAGRVVGTLTLVDGEGETCVARDAVLVPPAPKA
jgi:valyl-tRNA synthetase